MTEHLLFNDVTLRLHLVHLGDVFSLRFFQLTHGGL
eukprot:CAMPEP_0172731246 /NCGR_PEP_ID=MMETSP1074-20121228/100718_1 /TAXON_ID=2916 /ORGANISM="Ceratium fusus, Strain PA161109" /LENGTH=35 /DNA_ID= /DNA_START= /DNA_END= /DNA_ORIENTATION=